MAALDLPLSEEQRMLQESVQRFLADNPHPGWRDLSASLGLAGIALSESVGGFGGGAIDIAVVMAELGRSEEHTSELQSLMRISYAVVCLQKQYTHKHSNHDLQRTDVLQ